MLTPEYVTVPATKLVPCRRVKVAVLIVNGSIASLKVAPAAVLIGTLVAPLALMVAVTVGAFVSGAVPVVKNQL